MAEGKQLDYKSAKIALTVSKSALTKAEKEFETNCKDIQKNSDAIHIKKVRIAASVMEALDVLVQIIIGLDDNVLSKPKEEHIQELESENKNIFKISEI